jgi:hypothetical protein
MSATIGLEQIEEVFGCEVSDEALETAAALRAIKRATTRFFTALL